MRLDELVSILSKRVGIAVNQSMLADALGITRQTISNRIKNESEVTVSELKKVEEFFNVNLQCLNSTGNSSEVSLDSVNL